jgi:hypothetical protein
VLEQKWSFSEIIFSLESSMGEDKGGTFIRSTLHNYALSSHLIHADESGLSLLWDRNHRPDEEREKLETAHMCRMLSDSLSYLFLVWSALAEVLKLDRGELNNAHQEAAPLFQQFHVGEEDFYQTQETQ